MDLPRLAVGLLRPAWCGGAGVDDVVDDEAKLLFSQLSGIGGRHADGGPMAGRGPAAQGLHQFAACLR